MPRHRNTPNGDERDEREPPNGDSTALPAHVTGSGTLDRVVETARDHAQVLTAENTGKAHAADWKHFSRWCQLKCTDLLPPSPEMIGLHLADLAAPMNGALSRSAS